MERTALSALARLLDSLSIEWTLIGALAANRYRASPRLTHDIDLLLADTGPGLDQLESALNSAGWSVRRADAEGELLRLRHGVPLDERYLAEWAHYWDVAALWESLRSKR